MRYRIDTGLINEAFDSASECPLCVIRQKVEEQFLTEYLNDAVTDDATRTRVNARGFCAEHYRKLLARPNKLSLALQNQTRLKVLKAAAAGAKDERSAKGIAERLKKETNCVLCDDLTEAMTCYYVTIAKTFSESPEFAEKLQNGKGFCLPHYAELLSHVKKAGSKAKDYAAALSYAEETALDRIEGELKWFCDKHDYRNRLKPLGASEDVLIRLYQKLYGKKTDE